MPYYDVTIIKFGTERVWAESAEQAEEEAREIESDGSFFLNIDVQVEEVQ